MDEKTHILIVEDVPTDAELARREIDKNYRKCVYKTVETRDDFLGALETFRPDLIVSDFKLPSFDGLTALKLTLERTPQTPVIILTGSQNEDTAVDCMKAGAADYVIKEHVKRLGPAVIAALEQKRLRIAKAHAEATLRENEQRYRIITENMTDTVWIMDMGFRTTYISPSVVKTRGFSLEELRDMPLDKHLTPVSVGVASAAIAKELTPERLARKNLGMSRTMELEFYRKDGSTFWSEVTMALVRDAEGNPAGFLGVGRDITERRQAEERLRESEQQYRELAENIDDIVYVTDGAGTIVVLNAALERAAGFSREELLGTNYRDLLVSESHQDAVKIFRKQKAGQDPGLMELRFRDKEGREKILEIREKLVWEGNRIVEIHGLGRDITERKRSEALLKESESKYRSILETIDEGYFEVDLRGSFTFFNESMARMLGYSPADLMGLNYRTYMDEQNAKEVFKTFNAVFRTGVPRRALDWGLIRKDGTRLVVETSVSLKRDTSGEPIGFFGVAHDVTERTRAEEELRESEERYRTLFESATVGIFRSSPEGKILMANPSLASLLGYDSPDDMLASISDLGTDLYLDPNERQEVMSELMRTGGWIRREVKVRRKDGEIRIADLSIRVIRDGQGMVEYIEGFAHDITERRLAEEELKTSEDRYRELFENMSSGVAVYEVVDGGKDFVFRDFNKAGERIDGDKREDIIGRSIFEVRLGVEEFGLIDVFRRVLKTGKPEYHPISLYKDERLNKWYENFVYRLPSGEIVAVYDDVTERKLAEEALKKEQRDILLILNSSPVIIFYKDREGRYIRANKTFAETLGMTEEEIIGKTVFDLHSPEIAKTMTEDDQEVVKSGLPKLGIVESYESVKSIRWVQTDKVPIFGENNSVIGIAGFAQDITERKQAEDSIREINKALFERTAELKESEEKWRNLFESSKDAIYLSTVEGKFSDINRAGEELFGYGRDELLTMQVRDIYKDPPDRDVFIKEVAKKGFVKDYAVTFRKKDGALIDCLLTAGIKTNRDGETIGYQGIIHDVTEQKKMERQLIQAEKLSSLGGILSGVAHELNNPLTAVIGNAQLLMRKEISPEIKDKLEVIRKESVRSSKIIQGLLTFAREHKPERRLISVNDVIKETYDLREYEMRVSDVTMLLDLADDIPVTAADPYQLQQVFINLVNNAHDALVTKGGGTLVVRSSLRDGAVTIEFIDDGPGIPESIMNSIFDPFFTTKEVGKGTGLGLSIAYGIVKEHNGSIDVVSTPGKGTTFTIHLPVSRETMRKEERPEERPKRPEGEKAVLVVEDERSLREMIKEVLKEEGYVVESADGGEKAIELIKRRRYDAVVTDLKMPGISGKDLYTFIQKNRPDLVDKVLFITGDVLGRETQGFLRITGSPFIEKPFRIEVLLARLADILKS